MLYTAEKKSYLGFIPNDQCAFVDRLRKVIQQQKTSHSIRQGQVCIGTTEINVHFIQIMFTYTSRGIGKKGH